MPVTLTSTDFYAHHSPFGAFASFSLGRYGKKGGFGLELSGPAQDDVYIGVARPGKTLQAFPFYAGAQSGGSEAYTGEATSATAKIGWDAFDPKTITRLIGWSSDTWTAGDVTFRLLTPFKVVPDPLMTNDDELRLLTCPAILAEITIDNRSSETEAFAVFGIGTGDALRPLIDATEGRLRGFAQETRWGFSVVRDGSWDDGDITEVQHWGIQEAVADVLAGKKPLLNRLANRAALLLRVPPGKKRTYTLALGFYRHGVVTSGIRASYLYTRLLPDLESVLYYAGENAGFYRETAMTRDVELDFTNLSDDRKFLLAHATHSYHGSTMLLNDDTVSLGLSAVDGRHHPLWVVNEGEYKMMNTFDLTVDHAFFELKYHPWTLRNTMDLFVSRYSYDDEVQDATDPDRPHFPGGISFTHDMGVANQFSPFGYSSYERPNLDDCFSYMTGEQLCNWCLCAALYALTTEDRYWLGLRRNTLVACLHSLVNRDGPDGIRNGILSLDAARCEVGQEITTYDSLDTSLGQTRANAYIAVKVWAAYLALSRCFNALGMGEETAIAEEQAATAAGSIAAQFDQKKGYLPAVFEKGNPGNKSKIIPAIEGLIYPYFLGDEDAVSENGPFGELIGLLKKHLETVLVKGTCLDKKSGGCKLSSTSDNTWMSKIFLSQFVAEAVLGVKLAPEIDKAHVQWQQEGDCRDFAFTDQVRSTDGKDLGSRYYPRGVTAILWMD